MQFLTILQDLSPLELVKVARKAHGESIATDVGTEEDLWGPQDGQLNVHKDKKAAVPRVNMSMPTHLKIGLLPPKNHTT